MFRKQSRLRLAVVVTGLLALSLVSLASAGGSYAIRNGTVSMGGGVVSNGCFSLGASIGEPASGSVSNGTYTLTTGFQPTTEPGAIVVDRIFQNSFDQGNCSP